MPRGLAVPRTPQTQPPLPPTADQASSETETCFSPATMRAAEGREVGVPPACGGEPGNPASAWRRCAPPVLLASPLGKSDLGDDLRLFAGVFLGAHRARFMQRLQVLQPLTNGRLRWRRCRCPDPGPGGGRLLGGGPPHHGHDLLAHYRQGAYVDFATDRQVVG